MFVAGVSFQRREELLVLAIVRGSRWTGKKVVEEKQRIMGRFIGILFVRLPAEFARFNRVSMEWTPEFVVPPAPLPTHGPRTYPQSHRAAVYLWLQNKMCQDDEQTCKAALTKT